LYHFETIKTSFVTIRGFLEIEFYRGLASVSFNILYTKKYKTFCPDNEFQINETLFKNIEYLIEYYF